MKIIRGRVLVEGYAEGEALVSKEPISFLGDVDPKTGVIVKKDHPLRGLSIKDKIFVFPYGKGSTVGSYVIYQLVKNNAAPKAILNVKSEPIIIIGCVISEIPLMDSFEEDILEIIKNGDHVVVNGREGYIIIRKGL